MGCSTSRSELSPVESKFNLGELQLNYHTHQIKHLDMIHRKYSVNGQINENQWLDICKHLKLGYSHSSSSFNPNIRAFYETFKKKGLYPLSDLLTLAIVLGNGNVESKARLLFEAFCLDGSLEIEKEAVGRMHDVLFKNCVKRAVRIMMDSKSNVVSQAEVKEYVERLKEGREYFREDFVWSIVADGEAVSAEGFVEWFKDPKNKDVLTSIGFRKALKGHSPDVVQEHKKHESLTMSRLA